MPEVIEICRLDELDRYRLCWRSLLEKTRGASFFHSLEWLSCYWRHFGAEQKLRVLVVHDQDRPLGILPLTVLRERTRIGSVRVLTYPLHDWGTFYGPVGPNPMATLATGLLYLQSRPRDWDLLDLRFTNPATDRGRTMLAMQLARFPARESVWNTTSVVELKGSWDEYFATRTSKFRNNVRRSERRAARLGQVRYERYRPLGASHGEADPRWDLYDACVALAQRSWQSSSPNGTTLCHDSVRQFLRDAHAAAAHCGGLDLNVLRINGQVAAFAYNYQRAGTLAGMRMGYNPALAEISPGTLLLVRLIQDSFARGDQRLDLGTTPGPYKRQWSTQTLASYRYTHYAFGSLRSQLLRAKHSLCSRRPWRSTGGVQPSSLSCNPGTSTLAGSKPMLARM